MLKKITLTALSSMMAFTFTACSSGTETKAGPDMTKDQNVSASGNFDWKAYNGSTIRVIFSKHPWADVIQNNIGEFEKLTGIKVNLETLPEQQARQKLAVELAAGGQDVDAYMTAIQNERLLYSQAGWYADLKGLLENPKMTSPDYDFNDNYDGARKMVVEPDGSLTSLPIDLNPEILFYRKDLFEKAGLQPPKTLDELREAAKKLHNPPEVYGYVNRGLRNANVLNWGLILRSMGGDFTAKDGKTPTLNTKEAIKATEWYAGMLKDFGPPGAVNFNWNEAISMFSQGKVALTFDGANFASQFEDPAKSKVAGKVGYMLLPPDANTGIVDAASGVYGLALSKGSKKKEAAWYFAQWATGKQMTLKAQLSGIGTSRNSAWESPEFKNNSKMPAEWNKTFQEALKITKLPLPPVKGMNEYRDIVGIELQSVIQGTDAKTAMDRAQKNIEEFMIKDSK